MTGHRPGDSDTDNRRLFAGCLALGLILTLVAAWLISGIFTYAAPATQFINDGFEDGMGDDTTPCAVYWPDGTFKEWRNPSEIVVPPGWQCAFVEGPNGQPGQPEARPIRATPPYLDPPRIYEGGWAFQAFTFCRTHEVCLWQPIWVTPGQFYQVRAYTHNWCSTDQNDDPHVSDCEPGSITQTIRYGHSDNPFEWSVIASAEIYDEYAPIAGWFQATADQAGVAFCSEARWAVRNNDWYLDSVNIEPWQPPETYTLYLPIVTRPAVKSRLGVHTIRSAEGWWEFVNACPSVVKFVG